MGSYDEDVKKLQAKAWADLQEILSRPDPPEPDPLHAQKRLFLAQLIEMRLKQSLSQNQLARLSGLRQSTISRLENGKANPSLRTLLKIAKALNANLMLD